MNNKHINIQLFAPPTNITATTDVAPAISIDYVSRITQSLEDLRRILGVTNMTPVAAGSDIKIYKWTTTLANQVAEGETIGLSKAARTVDRAITVSLGKYRKETTAEAIQKSGRDVAINDTDAKLVGAIRKAVKTSFFTSFSGNASATAATAAATLQATLANVWAKLQKKHEDDDISPLFLVSTDDVATYLGTASITMQTEFGFSYVQNFLGLGDAIITPMLTAGAVYGVAKENLAGYYVPQNGDVAQSFNMIGDETGMVSMGHYPKSDNASIDTLLFCSVGFYPEMADCVIKGTITPST